MFFYLMHRKFSRIEIMKSSGGRGWHIIVYDVNIGEKEMFSARKFIGDDANRIKLDMSSRKRIRQVLFDKKEVHYYNVIKK